MWVNPMADWLREGFVLCTSPSGANGAWPKLCFEALEELGGRRVDGKVKVVAILEIR